MNIKRLIAAYSKSGIISNVIKKGKRTMKKNKLILTLGVLSILSCFQVSAKLIPITIGPNDTFELGVFTYDNMTGTTKSVTLYSSQDPLSREKTSSTITNPDITWFTFDTTGYDGAQKSTGKYPHYIHLAINGNGIGCQTKATLQTMKNAPKGTFKIFGINPMGAGTIKKNIGFEVTVK